MDDFSSIVGEGAWAYLASGINDLGQVVGELFTDPATALDPWRFLWSGSMSYLAPGYQGFGPPVNFAAAGSTRVNNAGQILVNIVVTNVVPVTRAYLYSSDGRGSDIGSLTGYPQCAGTAMNNSGDIVGVCYDAAHQSGAVFLYSKQKMFDLTALIDPTGWHISAAWGINDRGQIVGEAYDPLGNMYAVMLAPTDAYSFLGVDLQIHGLINGTFEFQVFSSRYSQVVVQASENAVTWVDVQTLIFQNGQAVFTDPTAGGRAQRFYRLKR